MLTPWKQSYDQPRQHIQKQRHYFVNKGPSSQGYGFSSGHVWMWELDYKEVQKRWCVWTVVLEKTLESPLDCKEIHSKGNQSWVFIGRTDVDAETPLLGSPDVKSWLIWKDPDAGKDWGPRGGGDSRGWDGWMASLTQWTWVWVNSASWWWTGRAVVPQFMESKRIGHDWATELNGGKVVHCFDFDLIFLTSDVEDLFMYLLAIYICSLEKCLLKNFAVLLLCCKEFFQRQGQASY